MESTRYFPSTDIPNLVVLSVPDEPTLKQSAENLASAGIKFKSFIEPDLNHQFTALATEPLSGKNRRFFKKFPLLRS